MYRQLGEASLKDGAHIEIGVIVAPDAEHAGQIRPLLNHKILPWSWHLDRSVVEPLDNLETYFYVAKRDGRIFANIMTVEHCGVGILGHVYTNPEFRRLGACNAIMARQMEDFRSRGGRALYLGTGFDSPPYHIYQRHGFRSVFPRSGFMSYFTRPDFEATYFAERDAHVREVRWDDWGPMTALTGRLDGEWLRLALWRIAGPTNFEGGFLSLKHRIECGEGLTARVLVTDDGARVGLATCAPHPLWEDVHLLDALIHPNFLAQAATLIESVLPENGKVQAYIDEEASDKAATLKALGFRVEATLKGQVTRRLRPDWRPNPDTVMFDESAFDDRRLDVLVFSTNDRRPALSSSRAHGEDSRSACC